MKFKRVLACGLIGLNLMSCATSGMVQAKVKDGKKNVSSFKDYILYVVLLPCVGGCLGLSIKNYIENKAKNKKQEEQINNLMKSNLQNQNNSEIKELQTQINTLKQKVDGIKSQPTQSQQDLGSIIQPLENKVNALDTQIKEILDGQAKNEALQKQIEKLSNLSVELQKLEQKTNNFADLQNSFTQMQETLDQQVNNIKTVNTVLGAWADGVYKKLNECESKIQGFESRLDSINSEVQRTLDQEVQKYMALENSIKEVQTIKNQNAELQKQINDMNSGIEKYKNDLKMQVEGLVGQLNGMNSEVQRTLDQQKTQLNQAIKELNNGYQTCNDKIDAKLENLQDNIDKLNNLSTQMATLQGDINSLKSRADNSEIQFAAINDAVNQIKSIQRRAVNAAESESRGMKLDIADVKNQIRQNDVGRSKLLSSVVNNEDEMANTAEIDTLLQCLVDDMSVSKSGPTGVSSTVIKKGDVTNSGSFDANQGGSNLPANLQLSPLQSQRKDDAENKKVADPKQRPKSNIVYMRDPDAARITAQTLKEARAVHRQQKAAAAAATKK